MRSVFLFGQLPSTQILQTPAFEGVRMIISDSDELLGFAQQVLSLLDGGQRVATYKLAVLLALTDCCSLGRADHDVVRLIDLADRVLQLYWPQVRPSPFGKSLRQSEQPRALLVDLVANLRAAAASKHLVSPAQVAQQMAREYQQCVFEIGVVLASQPLPKLQRPQGWRFRDPYPRPLYDDTVYPNKSASRRKVASGEFDIRLHPGVAARLSALTVLLRPLLELAWARQVAELSQLNAEEVDLQRFLFGADRKALDVVRADMLENQSHKCFYCGRKITLSATQVDHFIPWSRIPEDGLANLVAADAACNQDKSDRLPSAQHLRSWFERDRESLQEVAAKRQWPLRLEECTAAVRATYASVPAGIPLWSGVKQRSMADPAELRLVLSR